MQMMACCRVSRLPLPQLLLLRLGLGWPRLLSPPWGQAARLLMSADSS